MTEQPKEHNTTFFKKIKSFLVDSLLKPIIAFFKSIAAIFVSKKNDTTTRAEANNELTKTHNEQIDELNKNHKEYIELIKQLSNFNDKIQRHFETTLYMLKQELNATKDISHTTKLNDEIKMVNLSKNKILHAYKNSNIKKFYNLIAEYLSNNQAKPHNIKGEIKFSKAKEILNHIEDEMDILENKDLEKLTKGYRLHNAIVNGKVEVVEKILSEGYSCDLTCVDKDNKTALQVAFLSKAQSNDRIRSTAGAGTKILNLILAGMEELDRKLDKAIDEKEDPTTIYNLIPQNENIIIYALREKKDKLFYYMMEHYNEFKPNENTPHANEPPSYYETMTTDPDKIKALKEIKVLEEIKRSNNTRLLY